jgi:hypothetical protein
LGDSARRAGPGCARDLGHQALVEVEEVMTGPKQSSSGSDELIDWLNDQIRFHGTSAAANDPAIQGHIAFLQRAIARLNGVAQRPADSGEPVAWQYKHESNGDDGWCMLKAGDDPTEFLKQWPSIKYDVRPLYASPPAPLQAGTWMPIETAPKNRLLLVGFFNAVGKWRSMHAQYRDDLPQHDDADDGDAYYNEITTNSPPTGCATLSKRG